MIVNWEIDLKKNQTDHTHVKTTETDKEGYREISGLRAHVYFHHYSSLLASNSSLMMINSDMLIAHMQGWVRSGLLYGYMTFAWKLRHVCFYNM